MVLRTLSGWGSITDIVYQSDGSMYYDWCRRLIEIGGAYVCTCEPERFRELKLGRMPVPQTGIRRT